MTYEPLGGSGSAPGERSDHGEEPDAGFVIWTAHRPVFEALNNDKHMGRLIALLVIVTICMCTIIAEISLMVQGAPVANYVAVLAPLSGIAGGITTRFLDSKSKSKGMNDGRA